MWIRRDGRVLTRRRPGKLDDLDGTGPDRFIWREGQVPPALVRKLEQLTQKSGVCHAASTPGFSVGGAYLIVLDFGPQLRCRYRRRATPGCPGCPIARMRDALINIINTAEAAPAIAQGERTDRWDLGPLAPSL